MKETSIGNNPKRFVFWCIASLLLLSVCTALFAVYGVRPSALGGIGETSAYAVFLSILYLLDTVCLCLVGGIKVQAGFPAAMSVTAVLALIFPEWWGSPCYGITLHFGEGTGAVRLLAAAVWLLGLVGFAVGIHLHGKGWGAKIQPEPVEKIDVDAFLKELREEQEAMQKEDPKQK